MKPCHVSAEDMPKVGPLVQKLITTVFANLPGSDEKKCQNEALREAVKKEMEWPHPPGGRLLFTQLRLHRERAKAPEKKPPKRRGPPKKRGPPSPSPPPPPQRRTRPATAKPAALTEQDQDTSAIVAVGPPTSMVAVVQRALRAHAGESEACANAPQTVEVKKDGGKWRKFTSQREAATKVPGLTRQVLSGLLEGEASDNFEARLVSKKRPISKPMAFLQAADALGLRNNVNRFARDAADLDAWALGLVDRVVLPDSVKVRPPSWEGLLRCVVALPSRDQRELVEQTRRAEDKRVQKLLTSNLLGGRDAQRESRRLAAEASALATEAAHVDLEQLGYFDEDGVRDDEDLLVDKENVRVSFVPDYVSRPDGPAMVSYKGGPAELKAAGWKFRLGFGPGDLLIEKDGVVEATLRRPTSAHASVLSMELASGKTGRKHGGIGGPYFATLTARQDAWEYLQQLPHDPWLQLSRVGFHEAPIYRTAATTCDGQVVDGAGTTVLGLFLTADGPDLIGEFDNELFRLSEMLRATTRAAPQLSHRVRAGYRRDINGTSRNPSIELCRPQRYRGCTKLALRKLQFAKTHGFPIIHEVMRRCIANCVTFELVAYSEIWPDRPRFHVDSAVALLLSSRQMTSATMKEGANLKPSKQHFTRAELAPMEECGGDDSVI